MSRVSVAGLTVGLSKSKAEVVSDVSFSIAAGEIVGLLGESGSGKTTVATAMLGHARKGTEIVSGTVTVDGVEILGLSRADLRSARGRVISYVPQDPAAALDPSMTIGRHLRETFLAHNVSPLSSRMLGLRMSKDSSSATPINSREANGSACALRWPLPASPHASCWTSPRLVSMSRPRPRF